MFSCRIERPNRFGPDRKSSPTRRSRPAVNRYRPSLRQGDMSVIEPPRYPSPTDRYPTTPPRYWAPPDPAARSTRDGSEAEEPPAGRRWRRFLLAVVAIALIGGSLAIDRSGIFIVPVLFALVVPFEKLFPRHRQRIRRPQVGTDIGYALAGPLLSGIGLAAGVVVAVVSLAWLPGLALRPVVGAIPPAVAPFVGIALFDLAIYWTHRWYHEVPVLWKFHAIHHSPDHMDWISGFRNHPFDGTLIAPAFVFLLAAGFTAEFTGALAIIQIVLGIFLHANVRWRLRPLHRLIITPEFHHWHHANEPGAINSNYSVFLPLWDLVFGTYFMPRNRRPQVYGVSEHVPPGMAAQLWHPLRGMGNPLRAVIHPIRSIKATFRFTRRLLGEMWRSARRPRRRSHEGDHVTVSSDQAVPPTPQPVAWPAGSPPVLRMAVQPTTVHRVTQPLVTQSMVTQSTVTHASVNQATVTQPMGPAFDPTQPMGPAYDPTRSMDVEQPPLRTLAEIMQWRDRP